jgi:hypothetical protein
MDRPGPAMDAADQRLRTAHTTRRDGHVDPHRRACPLVVDLPAAVLARCPGSDLSSAVAWQRAAAGDWHPYAARGKPHTRHWPFRCAGRVVEE